MAEHMELIEPTATPDSQTRYGATDRNHMTMKNGLKVDFVLVYNKPKEEDADEEEEQEKVEMRKEYEQNLEKDGLMLEHVPGTCSGSEDLVFVLIHAPWEFLCNYAEKMMIRVPVGEPDARQEEASRMKKLKKATSFLNPFRVKSAATKEGKRYVTTFFRKEHVKSFLIEDKETFFDDNDRSRMVKFALNSTKYSSVMEDFGIARLLHREVYTDSYRLHDGSAFVEEGMFPETDRQRLQRDWARFGQWYKHQPMNAIKQYLGIRVGLYFAWLGTYNFMLIFAAIVGLLCFIIGLITMNGFVPALETCNKNNTRKFYMCPLCDKVCSFWSLVSICMYTKISHLFDNGATVFFAVFMSLWSTVFLEVWKRKQISLSYQWDMLEFHEDIQPLRPAFVASVKRSRPNPITGKMEPYLPRFTQIRRSACSLSIIVFMVVLALAAVAGVIIYRAAIATILAAQSRNIIHSQSLTITSATASALNLVAITIMSKIYWQLAKFLTNWENPRTQGEYRDNLTVKMFLFEFVNYYSSLFYVAFFKSNLIVGYPGHYNRVGKYRLQGCSTSGCLLGLCIQLAVIMIGKQAINSFIEYAIPSLLNWWKRRREGNLQNKHDESLPQWEKDYSLNPEPDFRLFHQYLDMVIQFGFVTMFVAAFPLAPLFALINNIFELRIDAINFVVNFRRPVAERAQTIGVWYGILLALSKIAVVVNSFVIAFTSDFIPREVYRFVYSPDESLTGYVDNSLSYFNVSDFRKDSLPLNPFATLPFNRTVCRYKGYHEPQEPYRYSRQFFLVMTARLAFVVVFQYFVFCTVGVLAWIIPDVPRELEIKIKREDYIAKEKLARSEMEAAADAP